MDNLDSLWQGKLNDSGSTDIELHNIKCGSLNKVMLSDIIDLKDDLQFNLKFNLEVLQFSNAIDPSEVPLFIIAYTTLDLDDGDIDYHIATDGENYCILNNYNGYIYIISTSSDNKVPSKTKVNRIIQDYLSKI